MALYFKFLFEIFSMQPPSCDFSDLSLSSHDTASVGVQSLSVIKLIVAPHAFTQKQLFIIPEGAYPPAGINSLSPHGRTNLYLLRWKNISSISLGLLLRARCHREPYCTLGIMQYNFSLFSAVRAFTVERIARNNSHPRAAGY